MRKVNLALGASESQSWVHGAAAGIKEAPFVFQWYSDQNHGITGLSTKHLYTHMTHFLKQCFSLSD